MVKNHKLILSDTKTEELIHICKMEQGDAHQFIIPYTLEQHHHKIQSPDVIYKSIWRDLEMIGFLILALDPDGQSVEFRRIVISQPGQGYGKKIIKMIEDICRNELRRSRVWLDVFETNARARHVYIRCGYKQFGQSEYKGKTLLLYEKTI
jgi:diamine N-acetyltransferase